MKRSALVVLSLFLLSATPGSMKPRPGPPAMGPVRLQARDLVAPADRGQALGALTGIPFGERRHIIVQLNRVPDAFERDALDLRGIRLVQYLPESAWFASVPGSLDPADPALGIVRAAWTIEQRDRLDPRLWSSDVPVHAITDTGEVRVKVLAFEDVAPEQLADRIRDVGAYVKAVSTRFGTVFADISRDLLPALASLDGVHWISPGSPRPSSEMYKARIYLRNEHVQLPPYSLTGAGVEVGVLEDGRVSLSHPDLAGRVTSGDAPQCPSPTAHATQSAGTIAGNGSGNSLYTGMAPAASIVSYCFDPNQDPDVDRYDDIDASLVDGIDVASNSWGFWCSEEPYNDYSAEAQIYDRQVTGDNPWGTATGAPTTVVFSAGNERDGSGDGTTDCINDLDPPYLNYGSLNQPKPAKNIIAVGAVDSEDDRMTTYSGWGPTSDGRLKPDLVAAGHHGGADAAGASDLLAVPDMHYLAPTNVAGAYGYFAATSAAAAMTSGNIALFIEDFRARNGGQDPLPSTVKAHLLHTARDLDDGTTWYNPGPDYASGYGLLDIQAAIRQLRDGEWVEGCVDHGETDTYWIAPTAATGNVKITLVWDDPPATPATTESALINHLDLVVRDTNGAQHFPWTLDHTNPSAPATRNSAQTTDNVEQVYVDSGIVPGLWTIEVAGTLVNQGPQCYSLVASKTDFDQDGDGYPVGTDCNDADPWIFPGLVESCDSVDDNCDGSVDEGCDGTCDEPELGVTEWLVSDSPGYTPFQGSMAWNPNDLEYGFLWVNNTDGTNKVYFRRISPIGGASEIVGVSEPDLGAQPRMVWSGSEYGVVWGDPTGGTRPLRFARLDRFGNRLGPVRHLVETGSSHAAIVWNGQDYAVLSGRSGSGVYLTWIDRDGFEKSGVSVAATSASVTCTELVWTGDGYGVLWVRSLTRGVNFARVDPEGNVVNSTSVTDPAAVVDGCASLTWNGTGYGVVWADGREATSQIYYQDLDSDGNPVGTEVQLTSDSYHSKYPRLVWAGEEYGLAWAHSNDTIQDEILFSRLSTAGTLIGNTLRLDPDSLASREPWPIWTGTFYGVSFFDPYKVWFRTLRCCDNIDGDGFNECNECNDANADVYPGAPQICDGFNNDCDDPGYPTPPPDDRDGDLDGSTPCGGDCDDSDPLRHPAAFEDCADGIDNDCDNLTDEGFAEICDGADNDCDAEVDEGLDRDADGLSSCFDSCPDVHNPGQTPPAVLAAVFSANELARLELPSGTKTTVASGLAGPAGVEASSDGATAYVVENTSGSLIAVNIATGATTPVAVGLSGPQGLDLTGDDARAFVANSVAGELVRIEVATGAIFTVAGGLANPVDVELTADETTAYVTEGSSGELSAVDLGSGTVTPVATGFNGPGGLALNAAEDTAYLGDYQTGEVWSVDLATGDATLVAAGLDTIIGLDVNADGDLLFATLTGDWQVPQSGSLVNVHIATGLIATVATGLDYPYLSSLLGEGCPPNICVDNDSDGYGVPGVTSCPGGPLPDCDDTTASRAPGLEELCDGIDNDCDLLMPGEVDQDGDGFLICAGDCDDTEDARYPGAPEINDGADNQCAGDLGAGLIDEVWGAGFDDPARLSWPAQQGATSYEVLRSTTADFTAGCTTFVVTDPFFDDPETPPPGTLFYYLVRALTPFGGDWGRDVPCLACAPDPPEICDGVDNDCNGSIDGPESTQFCDIPNAVPDCVAATCVVGSCSNDYWDLNGEAVDGCEYYCQFQSAEDPPDLAGIDANCDGVDGNVATAVFVSTTGNDAWPGSMSQPVRTIAHALQLASTAGRDQLLIDEGTYAESLTLVDGIGLFGAYSRAGGWYRAPEFETRILGGTTAVTATGLVSETVLERLTIDASDNTSPQGSSYGLFATGSDGLVLRACRVTAGRGGNGTQGASAGGRASDGGNGSLGQPGCEDGGLFCSNCSTPTGGQPGTNPLCPSAAGGSGGWPRKGSSPGFGGGASASGTPGGAGTPPGMNNWMPPPNYWGQAGANGAAGSTGSPGTFSLTASGYVPQVAGNGGSGQPGNGGGGGGGGGGGSSGCDSFGGGGGGGGGGGCGGIGGLGGNGGGGSIAVYLWNSDARIEACSLYASNAGFGGPGGFGQTGGFGGLGAVWGSSAGNVYGGSGEQDDGSNGARGGNGGDGGAGGQGGGGAGGPTIAVVRAGGSNPFIVDSTFFLSPPGEGGAPNGPLGILASVYP